MHENFTNDALDIKRECNDEEILDTIDNLKQEQITEETDTFVHHISEDEKVQFSCHMSENFVNVSYENLESTIIKTETEEDPLNFIDDLKQDVKAQVKSVQYYCDECEKTFSTKGHLKTHMLSIHDTLFTNTY